MKINILYLFFMCLAHKTWATIEWNGTSQLNVVNENLEITGDCQLTNPNLYIVADQADVTVTVKNQTLIQAGLEAQEISLVAIWPYTITIKVEHDLNFQGIENIETEPLYIYMFGNGEVRWEIKNDKHLKFNKTETSGPTQVWIGLFEGQLGHVFKASDKKQITFGEQCLIGYAVPSNNQWTGAYTIQSTNYDSSSKDHPHIIFHEGSKLTIQVIND